MNIKWILLLTVVFGGGLLALQINNYDLNRRNSLLDHVRIINSALDTKAIQSLSGSEADYFNPNYLYLKEQLTKIVDATVDARYAYLMAQKNGKTVILIDSQPSELGNENLAVPGEVYSEADDKLNRLLDEKGEIVAGPETDKWGTFVSAMTSIVDQDSKKIIALVGIDVEQKSWDFEMWKNVLMDVLVLLLVLVIEFVVYFGLKKEEKNSSRLAYLVSILEESDDAIYSIDLEEKITSWNSGAERLYGYSKEEAIGKNIMDLLVDRDQISQLRDDIKKVTMGRRLGYTERLGKNKKGITMTLLLTMSPIYNVANNVNLISVIARDISNKKQKDELLLKHNLELEKMNKLMMDRELVMMELKKKIKQYENK